MKQGCLVQTTNVMEADICIDYLLNRPKIEMMGLGLLYGKPGLGKTTYASRMAFCKGYLYLRLEATSTPKSFAQQLLSALYKRFGMGSYLPYGTSNSLFDKCKAILLEHDDTVIVIDEIDYAFRHPQLLGALRDIVDETLAIVILVGMQTAKDRLLQINEYYFDRCNIYYEFQPATKQDLAILTQEILDVKVNPDVVEHIHFHSCGNLRKAMKMIFGMEQSAIQLNLSELTIDNLGLR